MNPLPIDKLLDSDGENKAVRCFLLHYQNPPAKVLSIRTAFTKAGLQGFWPNFVEEASDPNEHLTKAGAGLWLRHLFDLENKIKESASANDSEVTLTLGPASSPQNPTIINSRWFEISDAAMMQIKDLSGISMGCKSILVESGVNSKELHINFPEVEEDVLSNKDETDLLVEAAEAYSKDYEDDPRPDVRCDVMNAFFRGSEYQKSRKTP